MGNATGKQVGISELSVRSRLVSCRNEFIDPNVNSSESSSVDSESEFEFYLPYPLTDNGAVSFLIVPSGFLIFAYLRSVLA